VDAERQVRPAYPSTPGPAHGRHLARRLASRAVAGICHGRWPPRWRDPRLWRDPRRSAWPVASSMRCVAT